MHVAGAQLQATIGGGSIETQMFLPKSLEIGESERRPLRQGGNGDHVPDMSHLLGPVGIEAQHAAAQLIDGDMAAARGQIHQGVEAATIPTLPEQRPRADDTVAVVALQQSRHGTQKATAVAAQLEPKPTARARLLSADGGMTEADREGP